MAENMYGLLCGAEDAVTALRAAFEHHDWALASDAARALLSAGGKLYQRLAAVADLVADGFAAAEVDRALARASQELPGQLTIGDALARVAAKESAKRKPSPRTGRGK